MSQFEIGYHLSGIQLDHPYSGALLQAAPIECQFPELRLTSCMRLARTAKLDESIDVHDQRTVNRIIAEYGDAPLQLLALLVVHPFDFVGYQAWIDGLEVRHKPSPKQMPDNLYNLAAAWRREFASQHYQVVINDALWPALEALIDAFQQKAIVGRAQLALPLNWFEKGSKELDSVDRLVAFWVAFNALYSDDRFRSEREQITRYVRGNIGLLKAEDFLKANLAELQRLSGLPVKLRGANPDIAAALAAVLKTIPPDPAVIIENAALTIYAVRNNLFHGQFDLSDEGVHQDIEVAEQLLARLIRSLVAGCVLGHPQAETKFVTHERFGG